jgi:phage terminase large subunit-like protein
VPNAFGLNAENFDLGAYVLALDEARTTDGRRGLDVPAWRRERTARDPLAFALIYLSHHLKSPATGDRVTFGDAHLDWALDAKRWCTPVENIGDDRQAYIGPREMGKSTWHFLIRPLWGAAHGWVRFIAAFADSATQAEGHLRTFRQELDTNARLREDYPDLCRPLTKATRKTNVSDNVALYQAESGFVFAARGIDSGLLGMKVGAVRPDLLILDDIEPSEASYSLGLMRKRLSTLVDAILPLNSFARLVIVGTVTMPGSIVHQLVRKARGLSEPGEEWIDEERIVPHYSPPIVLRADGTERSCWPARWPLEELRRIRHTRAYAKNFQNDPRGNDGDYWTADDFHEGDVAAATRVILSIDPAVTTKASSDFTGVAVVAYSPSERKVAVRFAVGVRLDPSRLRAYVLEKIAEYEVGGVLIETNQGGDVWLTILHDLPVPVKVVHQTEKKEVRAARVLTHYQAGRILHAPGLNSLEEQMVTFPKAPNDDMVDAVGTAVAFLLRKKKRPAARGSVARYA